MFSTPLPCVLVPKVLIAITVVPGSDEDEEGSHLLFRWLSTEFFFPEHKKGKQFLFRISHGYLQWKKKEAVLTSADPATLSQNQRMVRIEKDLKRSSGPLLCSE